LRYKGYWILGASVLVLCLSGFFLFLAVLLWSNGSDGVLGGRGDLAVVTVKGPIMESKEIVDQLDRVEKNDHIKGLILRIDSPGGGVGASQEIYQAVLRIRKKKKVIASLGGVAASGGYYIAVAADIIIANPGTITGSIGVLMDYVNVQDLLRFMKLHAELLTAGKLKDVGSPLKPMTEQDREFLQSILNNMHEQFKMAVQENRKIDQKKMDEIADGRIFTGQQALAVNLVDKLGNQQTAIDVAKEMLDIKGEPKLLFPKKKKTKLLDLLISGDLETKIFKWFYLVRERRALYMTKGIIQ